ncbi:pyridoxal phosphate-dependent aminotransferase [Halocatena pleomorpha]|uniref:Aminotransferase n=1 Tax=Halocatena pleomorpha TaxID=1785090 RepID=A0A3P3REY4_9EURY|nr:pyridoxal phosphate-dependent aminotransferase [Halocatena pleomorpha]
MSMNFTERIQRVEPSATIAISNLASELEADGVDVVDLSVGEPDFPTPEPIVDAAKDAMDAGHTGYAPSNGIPALRSAIADSLGERGLSYDPEEIMVTPGGKQALFEVVQTLVEDGSEVVLLDPAWVSYEAMVKIAGGSLKRVDLTPHDFQLEPALPELAETVSAQTDLMIVNSPSNPSGAVFSETALDGVRDLAVEHDVTVIADEMYDRITYGVEQTSLGTLDGMADRTVTVNGFSKAYSMTGWRLGYFAAPGDLVDQADKLQSHSVTCATNFVQHAGVAALTECEEYVTEMRDAFAERRDMLVDLFDDHGVDVPVGDGAFYMMVPVADDDQQWCENALSEAHVATVPGSAFGTPGYARLSYAASTERLKEGVDRLADNGYL